MPSVLFTDMPSEAQLMAASDQITATIAGSILDYAAEWSAGDVRQALQIVNYLARAVDDGGTDTWQDIVWACLMNRIQMLSQRINQTINPNPPQA
ncbi:MAG: hypothetical protein H7Y11_14515 [Armatimonadetes bacterium]|nr:hypothetical protein [Anaerolineae bacterium]